MAVHEESNRGEELIKSLKTVLTMTRDDITTALLDLIRENVVLEDKYKELKQKYLRLKEDKKENEAMYEQAIKNYVETINNLTGGK